MDLYKTIRTLQDERKRLDELIASLEDLQGSAKPQPRRKQLHRRGRKGMSPEERQRVSERMKKYWAAKRSGSAGSGDTSGRSSAAVSA